MNNEYALTKEQTEELRRSLDFLGGHIKNLQMWCKRGDTDSGLRECAQLVAQQYSIVLKKLPTQE